MPISSAISLACSSQFENNYFTEMCSGSKAGSYLRLIDFCITQRKAQGPSRTCNESKEQPLGRNMKRFRGGLVFKALRLVYHSTLGSRVIKKKKKKGKEEEEDLLLHALVRRPLSLHLFRAQSEPPTLDRMQKCAAVPRRARI